MNTGALLVSQTQYKAAEAGFFSRYYLSKIKNPESAQSETGTKTE